MQENFCYVAGEEEKKRKDKKRKYNSIQKSEKKS